MNNIKKNSGLTFSFAILPLLLAFSTSNVIAEETKNTDTKTETASKQTCLTFAQLKPGEKKTYSKCVRNFYNKTRCSKKVNLCLN